MTLDLTKTWSSFARKVRRRLGVGRAAYGDASFSQDPEKLIGELQEECLDLAGWGCILHTRLESARCALAQAECERHASSAPVASNGAQGQSSPPPGDEPILKLEGFEAQMLSALADRMDCTRGEVLRKALHLLFRLEYRFGKDGSAPVITDADPMLDAARRELQEPRTKRLESGDHKMLPSQSE